jgi:DNA-binding CsgD family transcriptional regulator
MSTWPLTGRAAEQETIDDELAADSAHRGVAIIGPAGVGKTRLAHEAAAAAAQRGWAIREVVGTTAARSIPMGAFSQWTDGPGGNPLHLVRHVIDALTATPTGSPVLLVVDDAHLLDDISAFTLLQLALRGLAHMVVTIRTGQSAPDAVTALWKDLHLARLDLNPLSRRETDALLTAALGGRVSVGCADQLWAFTHGNVLFLRQLIDHELHTHRLRFTGQQWHWDGPTDLPPSLVDIVGRQVGSLPDPVFDVIDLVAVAEPLEMAHLITLTDPSAVEDAEQRGLITISAAPNPMARMGHPLFGEVRRTQAGALRLKRLRGRLAQHVLTPHNTQSARPDPIRLGLLWLDSDLPPNRDLFTTAAWAAILRLDLALTDTLADAAIRAGAGIDVALLRARMLILLNRGADAAAVLDAIPTDGLPDVLRATVLQLHAANLLWIQAQPEQSWALIDDALAVEPATMAPALLAFRAVQLATSARPTDAVALAASIDRIQLSSLAAMLAIWALTIAHGDLGLPQHATALAQEGAALAAAAPEVSYETVNLACFHVAALALAGQIAEARRVAEQTLHQQADMPGITRSVAIAIAGMAALYGGDLPTAVDYLDSAVADFAAHGADSGTSYNDNGMSYQFLILRAEALARTGDTAAAQNALTLVRQSRPRSWAYLESDNQLAAAWAAAAHGDSTAAQHLANQAADFAASHGQYAREVLARQAALQFGDTDPAHMRRLEHLVTLVEGPRAALVARWARARERGDGDALGEVSDELERMGDQIAAADAAAHAAQCFTQQQRPGAALAAGNRAIRIAGSCGALTPATRSVAEPMPLSAREYDIAKLVADGLTNKQIADALTLSTRTVEGHIYRIRTRLGLTSRRELAHVITESGGRHGPPHENGPGAAPQADGEPGAQT